MLRSGKRNKVTLCDFKVSDENPAHILVLVDGDIRSGVRQSFVPVEPRLERRPITKHCPTQHQNADHDNAKADDDDTFHLVAEREGERWRRTSRVRICKPALPAAIRSTEKLGGSVMVTLQE